MILQSKNLVPRPKGVLCSSETDRHESENGPKNPIFQNFEKQKKLRFFLMSQGSFSPKIRFLGQKVCSVARRQTDTKVKMALKIQFFKISKNKKMRFFLMSQASFSPKIRFLGQKVCYVARRQTDRHARK